MIVINTCYYASRDLLGILFNEMYNYKIALTCLSAAAAVT